MKKVIQMHFKSPSTKYFMHMYENRIMKPTKNSFKGEGWIRKNNRRVNLIKVNYNASMERSQ
jgi:hypothetical protein